MDFDGSTSDEGQCYSVFLLLAAFRFLTALFPFAQPAEG